MSFCFNFDLSATTNTDDVQGNTSSTDKIDIVAKPVSTRQMLFSKVVRDWHHDVL